MHRPCAAFLASWLIVGCDSAAPSPDATSIVPNSPIVRDDAVALDTAVAHEDPVVPIIESAEPAFTDADFWNVSDEVELEIGLQNGPKEYLFGSIADVVRLRDGRIVVLDRMSSDIRFFSPTGVFISRSGGEGGGPGEYAYPSGLTIGRGDSIYVREQGRPRVTVIDSKGVFGRTYTFRFGSWAPRGGQHEVLEDGSVLMYGRGGGRTADGFMRDTITYHLWSASAEYVGPLARLAGATRWSRPELGQSFAYTPFGPGFWKSAGLGVRALLGTGMEPEIQVWGPDAKLQAIVRWKAPVRAVTRELRRQYVAYRLEDGLPSRRAGRIQWLSEVPYPESLPAYADLLSDDHGNVWIKDYHVPWEVGNRWTILSPEFRWLGSLTVAEGFDVKHVANGRVTGVFKGDLGVERVRVYTLKEGGG